MLCGRPQRLWPLCSRCCGRAEARLLHCSCSGVPCQEHPCSPTPGPGGDPPDAVCICPSSLLMLASGRSTAWSTGHGTGCLTSVSSLTSFRQNASGCLYSCSLCQTDLPQGVHCQHMHVSLSVPLIGYMLSRQLHAFNHFERHQWQLPKTGHSSSKRNNRLMQ